jgi:Transposase IS66 family
VVSRVPGPKNQVKQRPGREFLEFCKTRLADVRRFAAGTSIWPTNNISERGVRPLKTQQKISGRLASDDVTQDRLDIRGHIDTARKHGLGAYEVLYQLMTGNLWLPSPPDLPVTTRPNSRHHHRPFTGVNAYLVGSGESVCTGAQSARGTPTRLGSRSDGENPNGTSYRMWWLPGQVVSRALRRSFMSRNRCNGSVGLASNLARRK